MADPLTLAASIVTLLGALAAVSQTCHNIWERYQHAHHHLMSLDVECSALTTSLQAIRQVILAKNSEFQKMLKSDAEKSLFEDLKMTLGSCSIVISHLNEQIGKLYHATEAKRWYTFSGRAKYVWNEDAISSLLDRTRGLTGAINLILNTLQTQSIANVYQAIQERHLLVQNVHNNAKALELEDDDSNTIFLPVDQEKPAQTAEQASHLDELMNSPAYKRAFLKWLEQPDADGDGVIDSDTNLAGDSSNESLSDSSIGEESAHLASATHSLSLQDNQQTTAVPSNTAAPKETPPNAQIASILDSASRATPWDTESATLHETEAEEEQPPRYSSQPDLHAQQPPSSGAGTQQPVSRQLQPTPPTGPNQTITVAGPLNPSASAPTPATTDAPAPASTPANLDSARPKSKHWWSFGKTNADTAAKQAAEDEKAAAAEVEKHTRILRLQARLAETRADKDILCEAQDLIRDRVAATRGIRAIRACKRRIRAYEKELAELTGEEQAEPAEKPIKEKDRALRYAQQELQRSKEQAEKAETASVDSRSSEGTVATSSSIAKSRGTNVGSEFGGDAAQGKHKTKHLSKHKARRQARREQMQGILNRI